MQCPTRTRATSAGATIFKSWAAVLISSVLFCSLDASVVVVVLVPDVAVVTVVAATPITPVVGESVRAVPPTVMLEPAVSPTVMLAPIVSETALLVPAVSESAILAPVVLVLAAVSDAVELAFIPDVRVPVSTTRFLQGTVVVVVLALWRNAGVVFGI